MQAHKTADPTHTYHSVPIHLPCECITPETKITFHNGAINLLKETITVGEWQRGELQITVCIKCLLIP